MDNLSDKAQQNMSQLVVFRDRIRGANCRTFLLGIHHFWFDIAWTDSCSANAVMDRIPSRSRLKSAALRKLENQQMLSGQYPRSCQRLRPLP